MHRNEQGEFRSILLSGLLEAYHTFEVLSLICVRVGNSRAVALAKWLQWNSTLEKLSLRECNIGSEGIIAIAEALCSNRTLKDISLPCEAVSEEVAVSFVKMLKRNTVLEAVKVGSFSECGVNIFADGLYSLIIVQFESFPIDAGVIQPNCSSGWTLQDVHCDITTTRAGCAISQVSQSEISFPTYTCYVSVGEVRGTAMRFLNFDVGEHITGVQPKLN